MELQQTKRLCTQRKPSADGRAGRPAESGRVLLHLMRRSSLRCLRDSSLISTAQTLTAGLKTGLKNQTDILTKKVCRCLHLNVRQLRATVFRKVYASSTVRCALAPVRMAASSKRCEPLLTLLAGTRRGTAAVKNSTEVPPKVKSRPRSPATPLLTVHPKELKSGS